MPDISEAGFDQSYAARLNDASMGQVSVLRPSHVCTQVEDEEARGWLVNGIFSSMPGALRPLLPNVIGYRFAVRPWTGEPGTIRVRWGDEEEEAKGFAMVVVTDDDVEGPQHGDEGAHHRISGSRRARGPGCLVWREVLYTTTAALVAICQDPDDVLNVYIERLREAHHLMLEKK